MKAVVVVVGVLVVVAVVVGVASGRDNDAVKLTSAAESKTNLVIIVYFE